MLFKKHAFNVITLLIKTYFNVTYNIKNLQKTYTKMH